MPEAHVRDRRTINNQWRYNVLGKVGGTVKYKSIHRWKRGERCYHKTSSEITGLHPSREKGA